MQPILDELTAKLRKTTGNDSLTVEYDTRPLIALQPASQGQFGSRRRASRKPRRR